MDEESTLFKRLNSIDVSKHIEKKGSGDYSLSYLSWVWAWSKIKEIDPDMGQINKTKQRCFVKAVALQGLGLYIYAGEDLPNKDADKQIDKKSSSDFPTPTITEKEIAQISRGTKALSKLMNTPESDIKKTIQEKYKYRDINNIKQSQAKDIIEYISQSVNDLKK